jgi:hypothetical protein
VNKKVIDIDDSEVGKKVIENFTLFVSTIKESP